MNFGLFMILAVVLTGILTAVGTTTERDLLAGIGALSLFAVCILGFVGLCTRTEVQTMKIVETKTYQLAPVLINENGTPTIADDKYAIADNGRISFSYFAEDGIPIDVNVDSDLVAFGDSDDATSVIIKIGTLTDRREYFSIFFGEKKKDYAIYELHIPEDAILYKAYDGEHTQWKEVN